MGNTTSINIPSSVTESTVPVNAAAPSQEITTEITPNGGIRVTELSEPVATPKPATGDPKLILGKFKTMEEFEASYKELESKLGGKPPVTETPATVAAPTGLSIETATKTLTDKGLDYTEFANQYAQDGALSSASYEKLISKGITAQQIDAFIGSQAPAIAAAKAEAQVKIDDVITHAGGKEEFAKLVDFAAKTLTPAEVASYNRAVDAGDTIAAKLMLSNFKTQRDAKLGVEPNLNGGNPPQNGSTDVYQDLTQYHSDLRDPRYDKDAYFRKKIDAKIARSKNLYT